MKQLNITFNFTINKEFYDPYAARDLAIFILDEAWDAIYEAGLEPGNYEIKEVEVNECK